MSLFFHPVYYDLNLVILPQDLKMTNHIVYRNILQALFRYRYSLKQTHRPLMCILYLLTIMTNRYILDYVPPYPKTPIKLPQFMVYLGCTWVNKISETMTSATTVKSPTLGTHIRTVNNNIPHVSMWHIMHHHTLPCLGVVQFLILKFLGIDFIKKYWLYLNTRQHSTIFWNTKLHEL